MTRRHLALWALVGALLGAWLSPGRAYAEPEAGRRAESATAPHVAPRVTYVESWRTSAGRRYWVELSTGAAYRLPVCRFEDSPRCVWDAKRRGNRSGRSFVALPGGRVIFVSPRMMRAAYSPGR